MVGLKQIFSKFSAFGARGEGSAGLEGRSFSKMLKEAGLLDKKVTATDCDLIFAKVKGKGMKKISYDQFEQALGLIAEKKGHAITQVVECIVKAGGPKSHGTKAEPTKFYDDKSTFTGVHAHGGPSTVDGPKNLSQLCDRSFADACGISKARKN